ncbi:MAG: GTP-binding protein [Betaproteobacteria bacterium]|nr:GTP-binding protein [Betaproteobacteria bacterium]
MNDARTPVFVVTGFLGSGKTTLVNRLLAQAPESLVVVNEFGEASVDHALVEGARETTVALPGGCLCCRLRTDLEEALVGAAMRRRRGEIAGFDRVIIETSGLADPGPVLQTLFAEEALSRDFRLGKVVAVLDCADGAAREAAREIANAQVAAADVVVLSKADRAAPEQVMDARAEARALNSGAPALEGEFGDVDAGVLLEPAAAAWREETASAVHSAGIRSFSMNLGGGVPRAQVEAFISMLVQLCGSRLLRVKGAVELEGGERMLVQGVRHVFDRLRAAPPALHPGLVFIVEEIEAADVMALWRSVRALARA